MSELESERMDNIIHLFNLIIYANLQLTKPLFITLELGDGGHYTSQCKISKWTYAENVDITVEDIYMLDQINALLSCLYLNS